MPDDMDKTVAAIASLDVARRKKQAAEGLYPRWLELGLVMNKQSEPYCNADNVRKILACDSAFKTELWYDADSKIVMRGDRLWSDSDDNDLLVHLQSEYGLPRMMLEPCRQGVDQYSRSNARAPLTDWLSSLVWDGVDRLKHWLPDTYACDQNAYTEAVGRCWLISLIARAYKPGCQVDTMVVLEGAQGLRKSSSLEILGGPWYRAITQPFGTKEWLEAITGVVWLAEVADLSGFRGRDLDHLKAALTTRVDRYRRSYDRRALDYARRCVFTGTTNRDDWQADETGGRRFLPIRVREVDMEYIRKNREQLFAEAVQRYHQGEDWWDVPKIDAEREQELRRDDDVWQPRIEEFVANITEINVPRILEFCVDIKPEFQDKRTQMRVSSILKVLGFTRTVKKVGKATVRVWVRSGNQNTLDVGGNY